MGNKKALIICQSVHQGNTLKVAEAMAEVLGAEIKKPSEVNTEQFSEYDLIGFGSGIYNRTHHKSLLELVDRVETQSKVKSFIFSTATLPVKSTHKELREKLTAKGFDIVGELQCKGLMTHSFAKYCLGGLNKGRPNEEDLEKAKDFAIKMKEYLQ